MKIIAVVLVMLLTGCSTVLNTMAARYDNADRCQSRGQPNYQYPSFCGASAGTSYTTRDYNTGRYLTQTKEYK